MLGVQHWRWGRVPRPQQTRPHRVSKLVVLRSRPRVPGDQRPL